MRTLMAKSCPECGSKRLYAYIPSDGGPEPPKRECDDCGWWEVLTDD
jgi:hypothetical protein